jgi:hypothetical protein
MLLGEKEQAHTNPMHVIAPGGEVPEHLWHQLQPESATT